MYNTQLMLVAIDSLLQGNDNEKRIEKKKIKLKIPNQVWNDREIC